MVYDVPMKTIPVTLGKSVIVDDEDYDALSAYKWCLNGADRQYALRRTTKEEGNYLQLMHRQIMGVGKFSDNGIYVDHINGNTLDNRKSNLRFSTNQENARNSKKPSNNTSGHKGVFHYKDRDRYRAFIKYDGRQVHIGMFDTLDEAAEAYRNKAVELFGAFARFE